MALLALGALAGCGLFGSKAKETSQIYCPEARILDDGGRLTRFRDAGASDLTDVVLQARITGITANCRVAADRARVDVQIGLTATRGPAAHDPHHDLAYFVAVAGPDGDILNRESFSVPIELPERSAQAELVEELSIEIPLTDERLLGAYSIYAGIQLTPAELRYNRGGR